MPEPELTFQALSRQLPMRELPLVEPPADLWQRIAQRHATALRRARRQRLMLAFGGTAALVIACAGVGAFLARTPAAVEIDWQSRAQALEIRLHALDATSAQHTFTAAAEDELGRVDAALQSAYDSGADDQQLAALWKRRSELLGALVRARLQNAEISRI